MSGTATPNDPRLRVVAPDDAESVAEVARLFGEYAEWLSPIIVHTSIGQEIASLPEPFDPPTGRLLVGSAEPGGAVCGCVGVKRHDEAAAEIKRLFVSASCRGTGLGRALFSAALEAAREMGYTAALVSTLPAHMPIALAMYERLGFEQIGRFEDHTHADVDIRYLRLDLRPRGEKARQ